MLEEHRVILEDIAKRHATKYRPERSAYLDEYGTTPLLSLYFSDYDEHIAITVRGHEIITIDKPSDLRVTAIFDLNNPKCFEKLDKYILRTVIAECWNRHYVEATTEGSWL